MSQLEFNTSSPVERSTYFADVILPLAVPKKYTYRIPGMDCEKIEKGFRVIVQFGKRKIFTGIVSKIHEVPPGGYEAKLILAVLDDSPVITPVQLELFDWMAAYYMCTPGEVLQAALPSGLKLSSESKIQIHPVFSIETSEYEFSVEEIDILDIVQNNELMGYSEISDRLNKRNIYQSIKSLIDKNAVIVFEQVSEKFTPKREKRIVLSEKYRKEKSLQLLLNDLGAFEKQENILLGYYQIIKNEKRNLEDSMGVPYSSLTGAEYSKSSLQTLIKKEVFEKFEIIVPRIQIKEGIAKVKLSKEQDEVAGKILQSFEMKKPVLLHGITGSGKTEIYIDLINKVMESGQQVLFLLPEIAITTQMISRLYKAFGNSFGVYHSKYSDNERVEIWNGVLDESIRFVVGVRSSIFLPFQNLGLIIVDEEHETSYKQHQPSPRYHARDVALVLSRLHQCSIILGTATPSTESYFNAEKGKFDLIELNTRYGEAQLPEFKIIDIKTERQKKKTKGEFANLLLELLKSNLENNYQSILFQNRRGYSPILNCDDCGWTAKCVQCSVSLTYHQYKKELKCHYCGYSEPIPTTCPDCGSNKIKTVGFGTQKLEEDLSLLLPEAKIARMDLDTTRSKSSYDQIISNFENNEIDILIGTQIVTKGLDFGKVNLVGIVDFDRMINYPDFRSFERAFQLSIQVSGRAGRRDIPGKVIIQTRKPGTEIINYIQKNDWKGFYNDELLERKNYNYPPFTRLIKISVKHKFAETASKAAAHLTELLRERLNSTFLLGPEPGVISKIRNLYIYDILLKFYRNDADLQEKKNVIIDIENSIKANRNYTGVRINNDVDPG